MDYEKLHKETLQKLQEFVSKGKITEETAKGICADFVAESEDERIRKSLIEYLKECRNITSSEVMIGEYGKWLALLEKQKEQKNEEYSLEQAAEIFLKTLSLSPYNNKPITDAQIITKELLKFLSDASSYNPDALNEQKPVWSEEDESNLIDAIDAVLDVFYQEDCGGKELANWLKALKGRCISQPKQEWSKEDEVRLDEAIQMIESNGTWVRSEDAVKLVSDWLKALKDRCLPQQQEWSEEDAVMLNDCICAINAANEVDYSISEKERLTNFLKSLRPQTSQETNEKIDQIKTQIALCNGFNRKNRDKIFTLLDSLRPQKQWKPSEEQMKALQTAGNSFRAYEENHKILFSLYEQLKAL